VILLSWRETLRRLPALLLGLYLFGAGIAVMVEAELGLSPWAVFHQGLSELTGLTMGQITSLVGLAVVVGFVPLREKVGLGTILNAIVIGLSIDATGAVLPAFDAGPTRWAAMLAGPVLIAIGSGFYIGAGLGPGPRDGIMTGLARRGIDVWKARFGIELTVLVVGVRLGGSVGIGTVWFALAIGPMVQFFLGRLTMGERRAAPSPIPPTQATPQVSRSHSGQYKSPDRVGKRDRRSRSDRQ